ncbi:DUF1440 domain-containing protein [Granulicella cerasi]|uniref:DUF1440 domain-containing protein n=1 Tax=Granulicella cerasi TaxID=741063 RepID=A0ABW1Z9C5_9BACT|nr:DUF1440 domain-containing protein [Granulicella cerasi]
MAVKTEKHVVRGVLAGIAGGLVAAWMMNEFQAGPGKALTRAVNTPQENADAALHEGEPYQDATMKTADTLTELATGGRHLTWEQQERGGPIVHYAFGAIMGGLYGGLAELCSTASAGYGTGFGSALFVGADVLGVPALGLGAWPDEYPMHTLATPYAAHLVYGATTELVRRAVRKAL